MLDDDVDKKLRLYQAEFIKKNHCSCSFSQAINHAIRIHFSKK